MATPQTTPQTTPIWLDMRTEYIDANFDKFVDYLHKNINQQGDTFYRSSLELLRLRVVELIEHLSHEPLASQDAHGDEEALDNANLFYIRLLGVFLLADSNSDSLLRQRAFFCMLFVMAQECPSDKAEDLLELALKVMVGNGSFDPGFTWEDMLSFFPEVLASKVLSYAHVDSKAGTERFFEGNGQSRVAKNALQVMPPCPKEKLSSLASSLSFWDDALCIMSPANKKLKQSQQNDFEALAAFTKDYIQEMQPASMGLDNRQLKTYYPDEDKSIFVRITDISYDSISVVTTDPEYKPLSGVVLMKNALNITKGDMNKGFEKGYDISVRLSKIDANGKAEFDSTKDFVNYVVDDVACSGMATRGVATRITNKQNTMFLTEIGVPVYVHNQIFDMGAKAELILDEVGSNGYIKASVDSELDESVELDIEKAKIGLLRSFCFEPEEPVEDTKSPKVGAIDPADLRILARCLFLHQRLTEEPVERFRCLCALQILSRLVDDQQSQAFASFLSQYLDNAVRFAQSRYDEMYQPAVDPLLEEESAVKRRVATLNVLRCYQHPESEEALTEAIAGGDNSLAQLAQLIQSCNRLKGVLSDPMQNAIIHEVLRMLKVDGESEANLEEELGIYLGIENGHQEFKTSFYYPASNNMQPNPKAQRHNVFRAVCAFLNSESGGVVYLGVNDLGYISGLDTDLKYHGKGLDSYMRHIVDEAKAVFGLGIVTFLDVQAMYDDRVVAITVKPCDYKVVELEGVAYIRTSAESNPMTKQLRLRIQEKKRHFDKSKAESINALQLAIGEKRKVIVHGYSSSNGGDSRDRYLEPFSFTNGQTHVWCFDLESSKVKVFALSRISNVEILEDCWEYEKEHKEGHIDIFHMTGEKAIHMDLQLDRMAYNLLVEEYPGAKQDLAESQKDVWILSTDVYSVYGIGRFYIGLADHIDILSAPELEAYAHDYFVKHAR